MKIKQAGLFVIAVAGILWLSSTTVKAQQNNFQIAPPPIPYPYFEPGRMDYKLTGTYMSLSSDDSEISIGGGGVNGMLRYALNEQMALNGTLGMFGLSGEMPGFALPFFYGGNLWSPVVEGKAKLTGFNMPMSGNLEFQAINTPGGSLIFFGGLNLSMAIFSIKTPYHARTGVTNAGSTKFSMNTTAMLAGIQFGMQGGVPMGNFNFVPFMMMNMQSGSASFTFKNGYRDTDNLVEDSVVDIEPFTMTSFGADIMYIPWNLSFGTLLQQATSKKDQEGYKTVLVQLSWHFRK